MGQQNLNIDGQNRMEFFEGETLDNINSSISIEKNCSITNINNIEAEPTSTSNQIEFWDEYVHQRTATLIVSIPQIDDGLLLDTNISISDNSFEKRLNSPEG